MTKKTVSKTKSKSLRVDFQRRQAQKMATLEQRLNDLEARHAREDERTKQKGVYQTGGGPYLR